MGQGYRGRVIWRRLDLVLTDRPSGSSLPFCPSRIWHRIIVPEYVPQPAAKSPCFIMLIFRFYLLYVFVLYNLALITLNTYTLILLHLIKKIQASHQVVDLNKQTNYKHTNKQTKNEPRTNEQTNEPLCQRSHRTPHG